MAIFSYQEALKRHGTTSKEVKSLGVLDSAKSTEQPVEQPTSFLDKAQSFSTGFTKGLISEGAGTARLIQGLGQRTLAAIDPTKTLEDVRNTTGLSSLQGEQAKQIDELLKAENTAEKAGKLTEFIASMLTPTGSRKAVSTITTKGMEGVAKLGETIAPAIDTTTKLAQGIKDVTVMTAEGVGRIPSRIATNVAEKQATKEAIATLPTKIAKQAVNDGVDIADVKYLYTVPKEQKAVLKTLLKATQEFESGVSKTNPIEIVGKPIVERIKQLESARGTVGQKLGAVADTLGNVTTKEVYPSVFENLKKVPGLNGLKVNNKGVLDFTDTVLTTAGSASDRKAIQSIFSDAIKNGTGKQKHLLRQELFEILGGKKKSLTALTDTQEEAYEAIRKSLSDVLDTKNAQYKALNLEYAKVAQPLSDMRKFMKTIPEATEDILDMQAGLLARRLTSNAASNPQIRSILQAMDNATKVKGKAQISVENLQDFYNVLDKYYDIAGKTGLQKQVQTGVEKASGITDYLMQTIGGFAGKSDAVKRKAVENAIMEALK